MCKCTKVHVRKGDTDVIIMMRKELLCAVFGSKSIFQFFGGFCSSMDFHDVDPAGGPFLLVLSGVPSHKSLFGVELYEHHHHHHDHIYQHNTSEDRHDARLCCKND